MNAAVSLHDDHLAPIGIDNLLVQLDHYRKQSDWLAMANRLHARLAAATDLQSIIEAFSIWLTPLVGHDLIAYRDSCGKREHILCSCHGPKRRKAMKVTQTLFKDDRTTAGPAEPGRFQDDFYGIKRILLFQDDGGQFILLRRDRELGTAELEILNEAIEILIEPLHRALYYEDLFEQAHRDALTGLENRRVFENRIGSLLESAKRHGHPLTLACMDLDHFKQINDTRGHAEGDKALCQVAETLGSMVRASDLLVRLGGDEFALVLPNTDLRAAKILAERLCRAVAALGDKDTKGVNLGISIGLSQWRQGMSLETWLLRADETLYQAKAAGRSRVCSSID